MKSKIVKRTAAYWIKRLQLKPHPEGGYYRETYRSPEIIARDNLPKRYNGKRTFAAAIYFLLRNNQFSAFHRLKSDEIWHFYDGSPLSIFVIGKDGHRTTAKLGLNTEEGEQPQFVISAGSWFAAALAKPNPQPQASARSFSLKAGPPARLGEALRRSLVAEKFYALIGCTAAPGFDFADFELGNRGKLCRQFPRHRLLITKLTNPLKIKNT